MSRRLKTNDKLLGKPPTAPADFVFNVTKNNRRVKASFSYFHAFNRTD